MWKRNLHYYNNFNKKHDVLKKKNCGADKSTLLHLYRSLFRSKLDYDCIIHESARTSYLKALYVSYHQGLWLCLWVFRTSATGSIYVETNTSPLDLCRLELTLYKSKYKKPFFRLCHPQFEHLKDKIKEIN